jgi:hypothetical protein
VYVTPSVRPSITIVSGAPSVLDVAVFPYGFTAVGSSVITWKNQVLGVYPCGSSGVIVTVVPSTTGAARIGAGVGTLFAMAEIS